MNNLTVKSLQMMCRDMGFKNFQKLKKMELLTLLNTAPESKKDEKLQNFMKNLNNKYNIPMSELENLYENNLSLSKEEDKVCIIPISFKEIIDKNVYISNIKNITCRDKSSFSYLINSNNISQSQCIKMGIVLEKILAETIVSSNKNLKSIKIPNKKGEKEKDHLFIDENKKIVYYAELKANLNLDTEKSKSTFKKCLSIKEELQTMYPNHEIKMCLVGLRYYSKNILPRTIKNKYLEIDDNLCGMNDYLKIVGLDNLSFEDEDHYKNFINYIYKKMVLA
jgi:hypothetical protein